MSQSAIMNRKPFAIKFSVTSCEILSHVISAAHYFFGQIHFMDIPSCIRNAPGGLYKNLQRIWFARLLKKFISIGVRSPWRSHVLDLVHFDIPVPGNTGLIFVTCHTPWKRLLVNWFFDRHYALIVDTGKSAERKNRLKTSRKGYNELFHIIRHLKYGGRVIIAADVFNKSNDHPAEILGKPGNLSLLPARLARIAGVPLLAAVPILRNGRIDIQAGPLFENRITNSEIPTVMQSLLGFFENEIKQNPSIWSYFVNNPLYKYDKKHIE